MMKILILALTLFLFISCESDTKTVQMKEDETLVGVETLPAYAWQVYQTEELQSKENPGLLEYSRIEISINPENKKVNLNIEVFYSSIHNVSAMKFQTIASGYLDDKDKTKLNAEFENVYLTPSHDLISNEFNKKELCGFNDWITNQYKEILFTSCARESKTTFYLSLKGEFLTIYSCNENQPLDESCKKFKAQKMH